MASNGMVDRMGDLRRKTKDRHRPPHKHAIKLAKEQIGVGSGGGSGGAGGGGTSSSSYGSLEPSSSSSETETTATADAAGSGGQEVSETFKALAYHREEGLIQVAEIKSCALKIRELTKEYIVCVDGERERRIADEVGERIDIGKGDMEKVKNSFSSFVSFKCYGLWERKQVSERKSLNNYPHR